MGRSVEQTNNYDAMADYVDGPNLYQYVGSGPVQGLAPQGLEEEDWLARTKCNVKTGVIEIQRSDNFAKLHPCVQTVVLAHEGVHVQQQSECCKKANQKYSRESRGMSDRQKENLALRIFIDNQLWVAKNWAVFECPAHSLAYILCEIGRIVPGIDAACCAALTERGKEEKKLAENSCFFAEGKEVTRCPF